MTREIKFRIRLKCIKESEMWKIGEEMILINEVFDKQNGVAFWSIDRDIWEITSIEQFTGLTDKNRAKICEGDIVECYDHPTAVANTTGVVEFMHGYYNVNGYALHDYGTAWTEVIGNIHDNPNLLK